MPEISKTSPVKVAAPDRSKLEASMKVYSKVTQNEKRAIERAKFVLPEAVRSRVLS